VYVFVCTKTTYYLPALLMYGHTGGSFWKQHLQKSIKSIINVLCVFVIIVISLYFFFLLQREYIKEVCVWRQKHNSTQCDLSRWISYDINNVWNSNAPSTVWRIRMKTIIDVYITTECVFTSFVDNASRNKTHFYYFIFETIKHFPRMFEVSWYLYAYIYIYIYVIMHSFSTFIVE